jgi:acyl-CoA thioester hydrolase
VYWEDTDAGGIVFYANYLKFFERARTEWLRSLGLNQSNLLAEYGGFFVVSETTLKYHVPAKLDDELVATAQLETKGTVSLSIAQRCLRGEQCIAEGKIRIAWVQQGSFKPSRIPLPLLDKLGP